MIVPEEMDTAPLTQSDVALQRGGVLRARGPHPLLVFLDIVTRACAGDRARLAVVLEGLRRYQAAAPGVLRRVRPEAGRVAGVTLRDHGGKGPLVVVVPSLINPPTVLDLAPGNSFMDGLAARGMRALLVDWGPTEALGLEELVAQRLVPLVQSLGEPVAVVGYCLGGTLAVAAAQLLGPQVTRLALMATPWHFGGYGEARAGLADWWAGAGPLSTQLGVLPIELLQPAFWGLDGDGLAAKYARLAAGDDCELTAFAALEDWSNSGEPLSLAAARGLAEDLFRDDVTGCGGWVVAGRRIDPLALGVPILDIIAGRDRIVPPAAAMTSAGPGMAMRLDAGHVGMVVGGRAPGLLWDPLSRWLCG